MTSNFKRTIFLFKFILFFINVQNISKHPIVILIAFDSFRFDFTSRGKTPTLDQFRKAGVRTDYMQNVFPTKTFPNFFSIATGLYPETHGVLGNKAFDTNRECLSYGHELFHYNEDVLPIWTLNELTGNGRYSGTMLWISSQYKYRNRLPTFYQPYDNQTISWKDRVDTMLKWLLHEEKPVNLLHAYFEEPDTASHTFGMNSPQVYEQLQKIEDILQYFIIQLKNNYLDDKVNIIILSDHGIIDVDLNNIIDLNSMINPESYKLCGNSPVLQIMPNSGFEEEVYKNLTSVQNNQKKFCVYRQNEIPDRWHYKNNNRNIGILLVADIPYAFNDNVKGEHGYDNDEKTMKAFFTAVGPLFRKDYHIESLLNIDIYALLVYILKLDTSLISIKPNSTLSNIIKILGDDTVPELRNNITQTIFKYFMP